MDKTFEVLLITPEASIRRRAVSLSIPAESGYMCVLAGHAPALAVLVPGSITLRQEGNAGILRWQTAGKGFFRFAANAATVVLDSFESADRGTGSSA